MHATIIRFFQALVIVAVPAASVVALHAVDALDGAEAGTEMCEAEPSGFEGMRSQAASSASTITTTSTSDVVATSMTFSPGAGRYLVLWSGSVSGPNLGTVTTSIYVNGAVVTGTQQGNKGDGGTLSGTAINAFSAQAVVNLTAGQAIEGRWRTDTGTASMLTRILTIIALPAP